MDWAKLALAFVNLLDSLANWLRESQLIKQGQEKQQAIVTTAEVKETDEASQIRVEARRANSAVPSTDSLPNDGYRRD